jgi:hypothetical protein
LAHITAPDIASSTAAFMLLSTCSASMVQVRDWACGGRLPISHYLMLVHSPGHA